MHGVGVVGAGYWASNGLRVISESPTCELRAICDRSSEQLAKLADRYRDARLTEDFGAILHDDNIDLVYVVTPPVTHANLVRRALEAGKHVLVEKPFTTSSVDGALLVELAAERNLRLMVGHTFLYSPPVVKIRELIDEGVLGTLFYIDSHRVNLGRYQDSGVLWDLAPHDLSILMYWLGERVQAVSATGRSFVSSGRPDVVFLTVEFPSGVLAQIHLSWLAPTRLRRTTISGSNRMVVYDDTLGPEAVKVYDHGIDRDPLPSSFGEAQLTYRTGDVHMPKLANTEPLRAQWEHFVACVDRGEEPRTPGSQGLDIVRVLEACERALVTGHRQSVQYLDPPSAERRFGVTPDRSEAVASR